MPTPEVLAPLPIYSLPSTSFAPEYQRAIYSFIARCESEHTKSAYLQDLECFFRYYPGIESPGHISQEHILAFKNNLQERQYSTATIARRIACIRAFFQWLLQLELISKDPSRFVRSPSPDSETGKTPELSDEHVRRLLRQPDRSSRQGARDFCILSWFFHLGLRSSELTHLRAKDLSYESGWVLRVRGKGNRHRRMPLSDHLVDALEHHKLISGLDFGQPESLLFRAYKNNRTKLLENPLSNSYLRVMIQRYAIEAGIRTHVTPHCGRVTATGQAIERQASAESILNLFGWSPRSGLAMIRRYSKRRNEVRDSAARVISYEV
jgi:integrase/recombinase XerD